MHCYTSLTGAEEWGSDGCNSCPEQRNKVMNTNYVETYINGLRCGFTTGSAAAAAAKAAACMLLSGESFGQVDLKTPKGLLLRLDLEEITQTMEMVSCAVRKDAGDDPDVTNGALIYADVAKIPEKEVRISGGTGIGKVTKPGLDQPVGEYAINSTPRRMITEELQRVAERYKYSGGFFVRIRIPDGVRLAEKTFNPKLGIVGGISVLGTSGIVEPMSEDALLATIRIEINMRRELGWEIIPMAPGNYGRDFMKSSYGFELNTAVECSNYVGDALTMAAEMGFHKMLFTGHLGKLIKVAGGVMNTHSRYGDRRMEIICGIAAEHGASENLLKEISACVATDEAVRLLQEAGICDAVMQDAAERIQKHCMAKAGAIGNLNVEVVIFNNVSGELAVTKDARAYMDTLKKIIIDRPIQEV